MKKKILCMLMAVTLSLGVVACGEDAPIVESAEPVVSVEEIVESVEEPVASVEEPEEVIESVEASIEETVEKVEETQTVPVTIYVINSCGATIGGLAVIDPVTGEQVNLPTEIPDGSSTELSIDWPLSEQYFYMGVYNLGLELVSETTVDMTGIESMAVITISGNGDLESIDAEIF